MDPRTNVEGALVSKEGRKVDSQRPVKLSCRKEKVDEAFSRKFLTTLTVLSCDTDTKYSPSGDTYAALIDFLW